MADVRLIASTRFWGAPPLVPWTPDEDASDSENVIEFAGRACYQSWHRPNALTARIRGYIDNIRRQRHFSVFEHASATFYLTDISRDCTHQIIRHRHLSYSELSRRFVDAATAEHTVHPTIRKHLDESIDFGADVLDSMIESRSRYVRFVERLEGWGVRGKKAREAARSVIPGSLETRIVVTGNLRAWRHFINVRGSEHADAEIREVALGVARHLQLFVAPHVFDDLEFYEVGGEQCVRLKGAEVS